MNSSVSNAGKFYDISISSMGQSSKRFKNPFFKLKKIAMDSSINYEDRIQAIRYMSKIPHIEMLDNTLEASINIINDDNIPIGQRFFLFSNNDAYSKLDDYIVRNCHLHFFKTDIVAPLLYKLLSAQVIYTEFFHDNEDWKSARMFIINIAIDENETIHLRSEAADVLCRGITIMDNEIGSYVIEELGSMYFDNKMGTIYSNSQNVHDATITESVMNAVRSLAAEKKSVEKTSKFKLSENKDNSNNKAVYNTGIIFEKLKLLAEHHEESYKDKVFAAFNHLMIYPAKYEGLCLSDILVLIWTKIQSQSDSVKNELEKRVVEELYDMDCTCGSGYLSRIINILSGYISDENIQIRMSVAEQLRSNIFARINANFRFMSSHDKDVILDEISTDDSSKETAKEFVETYSVKDELEEEFVKSNLIAKDAFDIIYEKCVANFLGLA